MSVTRRGLLAGAGILLTLPLFTGCLMTSGSRGRFGFSIAPPSSDMRAFESDVTRTKDLGAKWVRFGVVAADVVTSWRGPGGVEFDDDEIQRYRRALDIVKGA